MRLQLIGISLGACFMMTACASSGPKYNAEQCSAMDWYAVGLADGKRGENPTALNDEISQCGAFGVSVDKAKYKLSRDQSPLSSTSQ